MYKNYVYVILSENRLIITQKEIIDKDYFLTFSVDSINPIFGINSCKCFCLGFIYGSNSGRKIKNLEDEFKI